MKNTDYSASAVKMVNPPEIQSMLETYHLTANRVKELQTKIDALIPQNLKDELNAEVLMMGAEVDSIKDVINQLGSYQDLDKGWYAVKQRKVSKSYNAEAFEKTYPQYAPAIIIKAVDTTKLNGLLKGGLITEQDLRKRMPAFAEDTVGNDPIMHESESFAYIIK